MTVEQAGLVYLSGMAILAAIITVWAGWEENPDCLGLFPFVMLWPLLAVAAVVLAPFVGIYFAALCMSRVVRR